jgi:hypothetical protein
VLVALTILSGEAAGSCDRAFGLGTRGRYIDVV